jgi:glutamate N-acetyltransferase/amino-acid N-acetyltransferase
MAIGDLRPDNWLAAAEGIMTTDTVAKAASRRVRLVSGPATVTGMAKGSGMIRPDMATMLGFIATDARVSRAVLQRLTKAAADR